jgi:hypothetical protein
MLGPTQRRTLRLPRDPDTALHALRSRLRPLRSGIPGAWFGAKLEPGLVGFALGNRFMLGVRPPGRNLWSNRRSPVVFGRLVSRPDGGSDLRLSVYRQGFPYRAIEDPEAEAFLDDWLSALEADLETP